MRLRLGDAALDESDRDARLPIFQQAQVFDGTGRRVGHQIDTILGKAFGIQLAPGVIGAAFRSCRHDEAVGRRRADKLKGDDEASDDQQQRRNDQHALRLQHLINPPPPDGARTRLGHA